MRGPERLKKICAEHQQVIEAIASGTSSAIVGALRDHLPELNAALVIPEGFVESMLGYADQYLLPRDVLALYHQLQEGDVFLFESDSTMPREWEPASLTGQSSLRAAIVQAIRNQARFVYVTSSELLDRYNAFVACVAKDARVPEEVVRDQVIHVDVAAGHADSTHEKMYCIPRGGTRAAFYYNRSDVEPAMTEREPYRWGYAGSIVRRAKSLEEARKLYRFVRALLVRDRECPDCAPEERVTLNHVIDALDRVYRLHMDQVSTA
jgi:hypothetical protein